MSKRRIRDRYVRELVEEGVALGWRFVRFSGHGGAVLEHPDGRRVNIYQTPRNTWIAERKVRAELRRKPA